MNFNWALEKMELGVKVRCSSWIKKDSWITLSGDLFICQTGKQAYFMKDHFLSNDWELFEEKTLSDYIACQQVIEGYKGILFDYEVKNFLQKLIANAEYASTKNWGDKAVRVSDIIKLAGPKLI